MRIPRSLPWVLVCASACAAAVSQTAPQWKSRVITDAEQGATYTELTLQGTYLVPPTNVNAQPSLVVQCADGKVQGNFFSFGAVLSLHVGGLYHVELQARIDDVRHPIGVDELSPDRTAAYFSRSDLKRMLFAKQIVVRAVEFAGPQMQASFTMPDASPIFDACGHDWILKPH